MGLKLHELLKKAGNEPSQALPRQIPPFVTVGDKRGSVASRSDDGEGAHIPFMTEL